MGNFCGIYLQLLVQEPASFTAVSSHVTHVSDEFGGGSHMPLIWLLGRLVEFFKAQDAAVQEDILLRIGEEGSFDLSMAVFAAIGPTFQIWSPSRQL